ncbi:flagellar hook-associated protein FlgL [Patulibacter brassicae]|jgi:flagellar hook-associated protein 3 FlgL|uniref:Flagellar hook-associated protein FlgL n=1 Tax=Patulibacter brassicae TaxID=1705717 RepID=A0ABU4VPD5_9ACTN|nr:flagellar hook-associated protein FlgL [Patulibacter brassicae]MDX8153197.1 flagellar hook-associated protein FlgL [Patulibacter brassicae]
MTTRITGAMSQRHLLTNLAGNTRRLNDAFDQLSSGKAINRPSDDPYGVTRAIGLRSELSQVAQQQRNVENAQGWNTASDSALSSVSDLLRRARTLLIGAGNDVGGQQSRDAAAAELDQLIESVKSAANTTYAGTHVFAGSNTGTPPYATGSDAYTGDAGGIVRTIGPGVDVQVNVDLGGQVLGSGGADGKVLATLRDIAAHMRSGTTADREALRSTDIQALDAGIDALGALRAQVGATGNRLEGASERLAQVEENATKQRSLIEDADYASAIMQYSTEQSVYQAALKSGAQILQTSLVDFLR